MHKTIEGKWILFAVDGGGQGQFWPIDARALIAQGTHTADPPDGTEAKLPPSAPRHAMPPQTAVAQTFVGPDGESPPTAPASKRKKE